MRFQKQARKTGIKRLISYIDFDYTVGRQKNGGGVIVAELKRVMISVPDGLLEEVDSIAVLTKQSRSQLIREAVREYVAQRKRKAMIASMKRGYQEMAEINLALAEEGLYADAENLEVSELLAAERE